jgi:hypothetical protein
MTRPNIDIMEFLDFDELSAKDRTNLIQSIILDFFGHYYIESPPDDIYTSLGKSWEILFNSNNVDEIWNAIESFWQYTYNYHKHNTIRISIDKNVTKNTLFKLIKRTFHGTRIDEMGIGGSTTANLKKGFIGENVIRYICENVLTDNPSPDVLITFEKQPKIDFIRNTLIELREKGKRA